MKSYDVVIIGGGAAGLTAAASFNSNIKACILEKNRIPGRKIMATGGGRCNITNEACRHKDTALEFFKSLGLETHPDSEGRYYPYSNRAEDVVEVLLAGIAKGNVDIITEFEAVSAEKVAEGISAEMPEEHFTVFDAKGRKVIGKSLILASGGKAAPQLGTTGDGYGMAKAFGHTVNKVYPILTGINCGDFRDIKGVRATGKVSLYKDGNKLAEDRGEIQFTEDGISGICVMNLTLHIRTEEGESLQEALKRYTVELDLAPDFEEADLAGRESSFGILCRRLSERVGIDTIKNWRMPITGVKGWREAQCTGGGVATEEIDMDTMESIIVPGLYMAGEILDVQGPCGGFNLQNAWETGIKAAKAINDTK